MSRIELAPEIGADFDLILNHLLEHQSRQAAARIRLIIGALDVLREHPLIGRPVHAGLRELVVGRGVSGYVVLYHYVPPIDTPFVLAVRSQREAGHVGRRAMRGGSGYMR